MVNIGLPSYLYVFECSMPDGFSCYKIGVSVNPQFRLLNFKRSYFYCEFKQVFSMKFERRIDALDVERHTCRQLRKHAVKGREWLKTDLARIQSAIQENANKVRGSFDLSDWIQEQSVQTN